ncbi:unnamed protein product, partial [Adineta ricciae]
ICSAFGIEQLVILVNKMDQTEPSFSQIRFDELKALSNQIPIIPISSRFGDNIVEESTNMPWFQGWSMNDQQGKTFLEILDAMTCLEDLSNEAFRMLIENVYKISGIGTVLLGKIQSGMIRTNMKIQINPLNLIEEIKLIEVNDETIQEAYAGSYVSFSVRSMDKKRIRRGMICSNVTNDLSGQISSFTAKDSSCISEGSQLIVYCHTSRISCQIIEIKSNECTLVKLVPLEVTHVEKFTDFPSLSRIWIGTLSKIIAVGTIIDIEKKI